MSYYSNYIGYKQSSKVGTTLVPIVTGEPITSVVASILATTAASLKIKIGQKLLLCRQNFITWTA
jgi:hypothetical protein